MCYMCARFRLKAESLLGAEHDAPDAQTSGLGATRALPIAALSRFCRNQVESLLVAQEGLGLTVSLALTRVHTNPHL